MSNDTLQRDLRLRCAPKQSIGYVMCAETILKALPAKKQTLLFSATMPKALTGIIASQVKQPVFQYEVSLLLQGVMFGCSPLPRRRRSS